MAQERLVRPLRSAIPAIGDASAVAPFQFVLSGTESLRVTVLADAASSECIVAGRMLRRNGEIHPFRFSVKTGLALVSVRDDFPLGEGALLTVYAEPASVSVEHGDMYATLAIVQGDGSNAITLGVLVQSYVAGRAPAVWPGTPFRSPLDGPGKAYSQTVAAPAVATFKQVAGGTGYRMRMSCMNFALTTDATAGNRTVNIQLFNAGRRVAVLQAPSAQPPVGQFGYTVLFGGSAILNATAGNVYIPGPPVFYLNDGDSFIVTWDPITAPGDQLGAVTYYAERWLVPPGQGEI